MNPPLHGLRVLELARVLAGPWAGQLLADLGADVVKVERPGTGDDTRAWGPPWRGDDATYNLGLNRNKRSVVLDLADAADRDLARRLALRADVLLESFRPGLMTTLVATLGLTPAALQPHPEPRHIRSTASAPPKTVPSVSTSCISRSICSRGISGYRAPSC